ncbi:MAG: hypothetical protein AAFV96_08070 [Pseudomonadota bacterium]
MTGPDDPAPLLSLTERWIAAAHDVEAQLPGARSGSAFWKDAVEAWFARAAEAGATPYFDALKAVEPLIGPNCAIPAPLHQAYRAFARQGGALVLSAVPEPEDRIAAFLPTWLRLSQGVSQGVSQAQEVSNQSPTAPPIAETGARGDVTLDIALASLDLHRIILAAIGGLNAPIGEAAQSAVLSTIDEGQVVLRRAAASGDARHLVSFAIEALETWSAVLGKSVVAKTRAAHNTTAQDAVSEPPIATLLPLLKTRIAAFLSTLDETVSATDTATGRPILAAHPELQDALLSGVARLVIRLPRWPKGATKGLGLLMAERFGGWLSVLAGGYPGGDALPSCFEREEAAPAVLSDRGFRSEIAGRAVAAWRSDFEKLVKQSGADATETETAAPRLQQIDLTPDIDSGTLTFLLGAISEAAENPRGAELLGADLTYTLTLIHDCGLEPKARSTATATPEAFERLWNHLAAQAIGSDVACRDGFVPFLLSRLLRRAMQTGWPQEPVAAPLLALLTAPQVDVYEGGNRLPRDGKTWLRDAIWRAETGGWAAMTPEATALRLDRALILLSLVERPLHRHAASSMRRIWAPAPVEDAAARRLQPPRAAHPALRAALDADPMRRDALRTLLQRGGMAELPEWSALLSASSPPTTPEEEAKITSIAELRARHRQRQQSGSEEEDSSE